jgi:alpha-mannosidase II
LYGGGGFAKNLDDFARMLVEQFKLKAARFTHKVIIKPHGDDFRFDTELEWDKQHRNMVKLMDYINAQPEWNVNIKFGTAKDYFDIVRTRINSGGAGEPLSTLSGDFFTYADAYDQYWSGYFTTRPFDKRLGRQVQESMRAAELMTSLAILTSAMTGYKFAHQPRILKALQTARRDLGLFQHHDAITGTSRLRTVLDYEQRLSAAFNATQGVLAETLTILLTEQQFLNEQVDTLPVLKPVLFQSTPQTRPAKSVITVTTKGVDVVFVNSFTQERTEIVSLLVDTLNIRILNDRKEPVRCQINPYWTGSNKRATDVFQVFFEVRIQPVGLAVYTLVNGGNTDVTNSRDSSTELATVSLINAQLETVENRFVYKRTNDTIRMENQFFSIKMVAELSTLIRLCYNKHKINCTMVDLDWFWYKSLSSGSNAYVFNPGDTPIRTDALRGKPTIRVVTGHVVSQVQVIADVYQQIFTVYHTTSSQGTVLFIENTVHIKVKTLNCDLIMRLKTSIKNNDTFFTDSNAFQMITRRNRDTLPPPGNYYPMTSSVAIQSADRRLTLHSSQPLGVASPREGHVEVMVDRMPLMSGKGLDQSVTDNKPTDSTFILQIEEMKQDGGNKMADREYILEHSLNSVLLNDMLQHPLYAFYTEHSTNLHSKTYLNTQFPCDTILSNYRNMINDRFEFIGTGLTLHRRGVACDVMETERHCDTNIGDVTIGKLFANFQPKAIKQMSLSHLKEQKRLTFSSNVKLSAMDLQSYYVEW